MSLSTLSKFKIRTLDAAGLRREAEALANIARGFAPDIVLGIRTGGYHVALMMESTFPNSTFLPITCRRPSTTTKQNSRVKEIISRLPHFITGYLRLAEHVLLTQLRAPRKRELVPDQAELAAIKRAMMEKNNQAKILIVDDSVDSGATLEAVLSAVHAIADGASIKTAAITVTTDRPLAMPDFALYRFVLFRFPWSLDVKK